MLKNDCIPHPIRVPANQNMKLATIAVFLLVVNCNAASSLWQVVGPPAAGVKNRRLEEVQDMRFVQFNWDHLLTTSTKSKSEASSAKQQKSMQLSMSVPVGSQEHDVTCYLKQSAVMHPDLVAKYPQVKAYVGECDKPELETVHLVFNSEDKESISMGFASTTTNRILYIDHASDETYVVYEYAKAKQVFSNSSAFTCGTVGHEKHARVLEDPNLRAPRSLQAAGIQKSYVFRLALIANNEYSAFHGNTLTSVLTAQATLMSRVNGIYMRELGIYFQLIADNDALICLGNCNLPNDSDLINLNGGFIANKNIPTNAYDIGHSVSTASGGVAGYPTLCTNRKADGTTGVKNPLGDPFAVDYVAHEIGHQTLGAHSFRNCGGQDGNLMEEGAVEPGSGSSIMGYAGICGQGTNLQLNSDPYFNSINLGQMREYVESVAGRNGCGTVTNTQVARPTIQALPATCSVPAGSSFALQGEITNPTSTSRFAWDRVDIGPEIFSQNAARFRSWKPTSSTARFFPNLYYQNFESAQNVEVLHQGPTTKSFTFRFITRTTYNSADTAGSQATGAVGAFSFKDIQVTADPKIAPLVFTNGAVLKSLTPMQQTTFTWNAESSSTSPNVKIMIAQNTLVQSTKTFDYEIDNKDLNWKLIAEVPNTGSATLEIPQLVDNQQIQVLLMIRSQNEACFFLDLVTGVTLNAAQGEPTATEPTATAAPAVNPNTIEAAPSSSSGSTIAIGVVAALGVGIFVAYQATKKSPAPPTQAMAQHAPRNYPVQYTSY